MLTSSLVVFLAALTCANAVPACTAGKRIEIAKLVTAAYAQPDATAASEAFRDIPFGVPDLDGPCTTEFWSNAGGLQAAGIDGNGVVNFGMATRQLFSSVTSEYDDFGTNGTTVINSNITMGVSSVVPIPVTFPSQTYLDFNDACQIDAVRIYADIANVDVEVEVDPYNLFPFTPAPADNVPADNVNVDIEVEVDPYNLYPFTNISISL